ncbi:3-oxoacyl-ACP reductase [Rhizobium sp. Leaf391]|uniref:SDR family NAD(P)-dependent oxidoreductase n=1 Tax=Rhizobium sp. Leaf391 TaxID=1736360 RepID=UPI00071357DA|nr:SDR family NAD(P)-dependent oxidoreductase [Rhizobium sp. Leaf391]KQT04534.1 3-oxoacyl-ACP reductase [Rhizobium sp. Leaf391]
MTSASPFRLDGKRALVTGAGRGLGRAIAISLAREGAFVTFCSRTAAELETAVTEVQNAGYAAEVLVADVTDCESFATTLGARDPYDVFVNNAGTNRPKPVQDVTFEDYDAVMGLNLKAAYFAAQAVIKGMLTAGIEGSIINVSSQMGHVGAANRSLYCASKWALEGMTKALAVELGPRRIRVNTICPTFIETPMTKSYFEDPAFRESVLSKIKLGRLATEEDIVGAAIFLASDASLMMTGSALLLDGGWTAE